ncbi:BamA/TamA family outer membrane protein [Olivibacter sp. SDN3]|uniref:BamA/TamA family outer membrane protein n=1 Tax=Olivibacter sp. SDN3 TaxID=2764720 RepID=UPI0016519701|nr:BamA/TamA family outer membrane protein [Olivibacter sp. SDN3]QNL48620.1 BamA/TamA family outer membrane protein [Olivibacter sp. SDN3]
MIAAHFRETVVPKLILITLCTFVSSIVYAQEDTTSDGSLALTSNGEKALFYKDKHLIVSDVPSDEILGNLALPADEPPYFYTISKDGKWLLYSSKEEKMTYIYNLEKGVALKQLLPVVFESAEFTGDGQHVYVIHSKTFWKANLAVYETENWQLLNMRSITDYTNSLAVNTDGSRLLAGARSIIRILDPQTLKTEKVNWETSRLRLLTFNPVNTYQYASVNHKNIIEVRDLEEDRVIHAIRPDGGKIGNLSYDPDGERLLSLDDQGKLNVWSLTDSLKVACLSEVKATQGFEQGKLTVLQKEGWRVIDQDWKNTGSEKNRSITPDTAFLGGPTKKIGVVPMPILAYSPETNVILGLGMNIIFNGHDYEKNLVSPFFRPSSLTPVVAYGFNGQLQASLSADYFYKKSWHFFNNIGFLKNNRSFYFGLGNDAENDRNTVYHNNIFSWNGEVTKLINESLFVGLNYHVRNDSRLDFDQSASLMIPNSEGGLLLGIGGTIRYDTRNDLLFPTSGRYIDLSLINYGKWIGSDYTYNDLKIDYRSFHSLPILTKGTTFAFQAIYHNVFNGNAPFYQLPYLSADRILRGVWRNLYIDRQAVALQGELRSNFSNIDPRYGYVLFAGAGDVSDNFFKGYDPKIIGVFGLGFRQQVIPKLKLQSRIDFSVTTRGSIGVFGGMGLTF